MSENERPPLEISEEVQQQARELVKKSLEMFAQHTKRMTEDLAQMNRKSQEVRERIERGARRTSGRIV